MVCSLSFDPADRVKRYACAPRPAVAPSAERRVRISISALGKWSCPGGRAASGLAHQRHGSALVATELGALTLFELRLSGRVAPTGGGRRSVARPSKRNALKARAIQRTARVLPSRVRHGRRAEMLKTLESGERE